MQKKNRVTVVISCKYCGEKRKESHRSSTLFMPGLRTPLSNISYHYKAYEAGVKERIVEMSLNGSGIRDIARVLQVGTNTAMSTLKKIHR